METTAKYLTFGFIYHRKRLEYIVCLLLFSESSRSYGGCIHGDITLGLLHMRPFQLCFRARGFHPSTAGFIPFLCVSTPGFLPQIDGCISGPEVLSPASYHILVRVDNTTVVAFINCVLAKVLQ